MPNENYKLTQITFRQIGGVWQSDEQKPRTFADFLDYYNIVWDDKMTLARYSIYYDNRNLNNLQIEIRAYSDNIRAFLTEF